MNFIDSQSERAGAIAIVMGVDRLGLMEGDRGCFEVL
jgi:hypothetical protein